MPSLSVGDESMQFDQYCAVGADCGSESIANGKLVEGLHTQNIELSNDKALWKEKAIMMEEALHEEAMERSKLQLSLDEAHRRLRLLAREPLMSSSSHARPFLPSAEISLLKNAVPPKQREDIWDSELELEDYLKRGDDDDLHYPNTTNEERTLELEEPLSEMGYWESTERELEKKANSLLRQPAGFNNKSVVQEVGEGFQSKRYQSNSSAAPHFQNWTVWKARVEELEYENSELEAQCLALKTSKKTASRIQEELKDRCVRIETEVNFVRTRINAAEEIARESQQVATTARKRIAELEYALAQRIARVKELELSLDEVNKLFDKSMESLSYKLTCVTSRADNAEVKASHLEQEKSLAEKENSKLKSLLTWQQQLKSRDLEEAEDRACEKAERKAAPPPLSISDNEPLMLLEKKRFERRLDDELKNVSRLLRESHDNMECVLAAQNEAIEEHRCIAAESIAHAKAQAEENEALRSELDHILDMHSQQAGNMDQRLLYERQRRQQLEDELKSNRKVYNELEAQVLQRNTLLSSLDQQLDMLSNNTKKRPSSVMEEV